MTKTRFKTPSLLGAGLLLVSAMVAPPAAADSLEIYISCKESPGKFVSSLQKHWLAPKPYQVVDSIHYWKVKTGQKLYFQGIPVKAIYGFSETEPGFKRGPGTSPGNLYGAILNVPHGVALRYINSTTIGNAEFGEYERDVTFIECKLD